VALIPRSTHVHSAFSNTDEESGFEPLFIDESVITVLRKSMSRFLNDHLIDEPAWRYPGPAAAGCPQIGSCLLDRVREGAYCISRLGGRHLRLLITGEADCLDVIGQCLLGDPNDF
jgi:hypothetical protein